MRRGRIIALLAVLCTVTGVVGSMPATAAAASPLDICRDLADGRLDNSYSQQDVDAYLAALRAGDPTLGGYCSPIVTTLVPPPPPGPPPVPCTEVSSDTAGATLAPNGKYYNNVPAGGVEQCGPAQRTQTCVEVPAGTPGATLAPNGKYYNNVPSGGAAVCGPAAPAPPQCVEVNAGTQGAVLAPNGKYYLNVPAGGPEVCGPAQAAAPAATRTQAVAAATKVKTTKPSKPAAVSPAQHSAAPLATTRSSGTLPFTGAELGIFALVGIALLGAGLMLRMTSRGHKSRS
jgi:hypothetical protein